MQGIEVFIPTQVKARYLNQLLKIGFDTLDFGSFVSPKAIPQMKDTAEVLFQLDLSDTQTKLLAIIANLRGAEKGCQFPEVSYLGFPLSLSETFQKRNTNKTISEAFNEIRHIQDLCKKHGKILVVYISMGFGNPYGDAYSPTIVEEFVGKLDSLEIQIVSLADTIGVSDPENISSLYSQVSQAFPNIELGAHLHSNPNQALDKISAAFEAGCKRFDGALRGYGGCPMAKDELVGNLATEKIIEYLETKGVLVSLDKPALALALQSIPQVFPY